MAPRSHGNQLSNFLDNTQGLVLKTHPCILLKCFMERQSLSTAGKVQFLWKLRSNLSDLLLQ